MAPDPPRLSYEKPLAPGEVRVERLANGAGVVISVGRRTTGQIVRSFWFTLLVLAGTSAGSLAMGAGLGLFMKLDAVSSRSADDVIGGTFSSLFMVLLAFIFGALVAHFWYRRSRTILLAVTLALVGVAPEDSRFMPIWVPRGRVTSVDVATGVVRAAIRIHLHAAPPLAALTGYAPAVVGRVVEEFRAALAAVPAVPLPPPWPTATRPTATRPTATRPTATRPHPTAR